MSFKDKIKAIELRRMGKSYTEILNEITVSRSTLSNWLRDIKLTDEQKQRLSKLQATGYKGAKANQLKSKKRREVLQKQAIQEVAQLINNQLFIAGLMLYWAEGNKSGNTVAFTNSDPRMISLIMKWFREICHISEKKSRINLFLHTLHIKKDCEKFWSGITGIPLNQFRKSYIKPTIYGRKKNKLYNGTYVIKIHNVDLMSRIKGWMVEVADFFSSGVK